MISARIVSSSLSKQPFKQPWRGKSLIPADMAQFGISDQNSILIADIL